MKRFLCILMVCLTFILTGCGGEKTEEEIAAKNAEGLGNLTAFQTYVNKEVDGIMHIVPYTKDGSEDWSILVATVEKDRSDYQAIIEEVQACADQKYYDSTYTPLGVALYTSDNLYIPVASENIPDGFYVQGYTGKALTQEQIDKYINKTEPEESEAAKFFKEHYEENLQSFKTEADEMIGGYVLAYSIDGESDKQINSLDLIVSNDLIGMTENEQLEVATEIIQNFGTTIRYHFGLSKNPPIYMRYMDGSFFARNETFNPEAATLSK